MFKKFVKIFLVLPIVVTCTRPSGNLSIDETIAVENLLIQGTFSTMDTTISFDFDDCSCSLNESGIFIRNQASLSSIIGIQQIAHIHNDSVNFFLETQIGFFGDTKRFRIQDSLLVVKKNSYAFGDSIEGRIRVSGYAATPDNSNKRIDIKVEGVFKCFLNDSAYHKNNYEDKFIDW